MSSRSTSSHNPTLTNYAQGLAQDVRSSLAEFLAPSVQVAATIGHYKKFNSQQDFQVYETSRALGGSATRIQFSATDGDYNCKPQSLEIAVDDSERLTTIDEGTALDEMKIRSLVHAAALAHEDKTLAAIKAGLSAVGSVGVWSDTSVDPIAEIDAQIEAITIATGVMPNRIAFGIHAWRTFRNHVKVVARQPGAQLIGMSVDDAAQALLNPHMEIRVGILSKDASKFGATKSAANIVGSEVFIFYANQNPDVYDPSFAKTFVNRLGGVTAVRTYRDERSRSDVHAVDWSEDIQITSSECGRRLTIS